MTRRPHRRPHSTVRGVLVVLAAVAVLTPLVLPAGSPAVGAPAAERPGPRPAATLALTAASLVAVGEDLVATAVSRPARPGTAVRLQVRRGAGWATVARARQDRRGAVTLRLAGPAEGLLAVRAVRGRARPVTSVVARVRVAPTEDVLPPVPGQVDGAAPDAMVVSRDSRVVVRTVAVADASPGGQTVRVAVHDRVDRTTRLLPVPAGTLAQGLPAISPSGRYVVSVSYVARELAAPENRVLLTDLRTGRTSVVPGPQSVTGLAVSSDGRRIAMTGTAWLAAGGVCAADPSQGGDRENDVYLLDRGTGRISCLSSGLDDRYAGKVGPPTLSVDGAVVSFGFGWTEGPDGASRGRLVRWEAGRRQLLETPGTGVRAHTDRVAAVVVGLPRADGEPDDLGLHDLARGTTDNLTADDDTGAWDAWISDDGAQLWFDSPGTNLVPTRPAPVGGNPGCLYRRTVATGTTVAAFCGTDRDPTATSGDGRFVAAVDGRSQVVTRFLPR